MLFVVPASSLEYQYVARPQIVPGEILLNGTCNSMPGWCARVNTAQSRVSSPFLPDHRAAHRRDPTGIWNPVDYHDDPDCRLNPMYNEVCVRANV